MKKSLCFLFAVFCLSFIVACPTLAANEDYSYRLGAYTTYVAPTSVAKVTPKSVATNILNNNEYCFTLADGITTAYFTRAWYRDGAYRQEATPNTLGSHESTIWAQYYNNFGNYGETYSLGLYNPHTEMIALGGNWTPN